MSIQEEVTRLNEARNTLRNKGVNLGIVLETDKLDAIATKFNQMANNGAVDAEVKEGETYTIPKGYHNGSGTVSGVAGGGNYSLQTKTVTPTKSEQNVSSDEGYYGLSAVTVNAIPAAYQDVTSVTATAADVLATKVIVDADGTIITGTMANNGAVSKVLDATTTSYTVPAGYHSGSGTVSIVPETKAVTLGRTPQTITPTTGKVLTSVTVPAISDDLQDVSGVTATADKLLTGYVFVDAEGSEISGTMPNVGSVSEELDAETRSFTIAKGYHDGTGTVTIPSTYYDVSAVTATAAQVLTGSKFVDAEGEVVNGTMANNGAGTKTIDGLTTTSVTIAAGYYDGSGTVSLTNDIETALAAI